LFLLISINSAIIFSFSVYNKVNNPNQIFSVEGLRVQHGAHEGDADDEGGVEVALPIRVVGLQPVKKLIPFFFFLCCFLGIWSTAKEFHFCKESSQNIFP
jgi:hypothetical protein